MIKHYFKLLILLTLTLMTSTAFSAPAMAILDEQNPSVNIGHVGSYYIDNSGNLTLRDIDSEALRKRFVPLKSSFLQFGMVEGNVWIRVDIAQQFTSNTPTVLHIKAPRLQIIDVYTPGLTNNQIFKEMGEARPFSSRSVSYPDYIVPLPTNVPPVYTLYVKVNSHLPINFLVEVKTLSSLSHDIQKDMAITGLLLGILALLFACNLFFFIKTRRAMYIIYSGLLVSIAALHLSMHGFIYQMFPDLPGLQERIYNFNSLLCAAAITYFTRSYLNTKTLLPRLDRALLTVGFINLTLALLYSIAPKELNIAILSFCAASTLIFLFVVSLYCANKRLPYASYYLTARVVLTSGYTVWLMSAYGIIPLPLWFQWGLTISIIMEALVHFTGIMTHLTPSKSAPTSHEPKQVESTDLLDDISTRINRHMAALNHYASLKPDMDDTQVKVAYGNLTSIAEKLKFMHWLHTDAKNAPSYSTLNLQILIEQALSSFQALDTSQAEIEINHDNIACWELTTNTYMIKQLYQTLMEELRHQTDQVLNIESSVESWDRSTANKCLHINVYPLPSSAAPDNDSGLGARYIQDLVAFLEGNLTITGDGRNRRMELSLPVSLNFIKASELAQQTQVEELILVLVGRDSDEIERTLNTLHSRLFSVSHIDQLDELLYLLHYRPDAAKFAVILFEDKQNFGTSQLERFKSELQEYDTCLLISNDVKMSEDYARNLGFDSYLYNSAIESNLISELERLQKEVKTSLSRIKKSSLND